MVSQKHVDAMREIADLWSRTHKLEQYRRAALGEIVVPEPMYPDERGIWPVTIPQRAMCQRVLEWNDGC